MPGKNDVEVSLKQNVYVSTSIGKAADKKEVSNCGNMTKKDEHLLHDCYEADTAGCFV